LRNWSATYTKVGTSNQNLSESPANYFLAVSDPSHSRYGQHLSSEEVNDLVKPEDETLELVHEWLYDNGIKNVNYSPSKDWIHIYIDVESAERLLDTEYSIFEHDDGDVLVRTSKWSLPLHLHERIDTIQPTTSLMRTKAQATTFKQYEQPWMPPGYTPPTNATISAVCQFFPVTIECFRTLYGTIDYTPKVPGLNKVAFNNYLNQTPIRPDIELFLKKYRPEAAETALTFKSIEIAGGPAAQYNNETAAEEATDPGDYAREANLDAETILGMTYPTPMWSFSTGGSPPFIEDVNTPTDTNEPYLTWLNYVTAQTELPQVISSSYGDDEQTVPQSYAIRACQMFAQLGARGITLFVSSGDGGLGGEDADSCVSSATNTTAFLPEFPASCPYVTTVGATEQFEPEVACWRPDGIGPDGKNHGFYASGSGFSNYFPRPAYQNGVVDTYVKNLNGLYEGLYNSSKHPIIFKPKSYSNNSTAGRGYPDVSAQGLYFAFAFNQTFSSISGTSASTPLTSSILSLVNDELLSCGRPPLGFLNPWLYSKGYKGFTDILSGNTSSCGTDGFPVTKGWDPVTGFGTPVFPELVKLAKGS
jgi:tripeptidyl-peptidase-1